MFPVLLHNTTHTRSTCIIMVDDIDSDDVSEFFGGVSGFKRTDGNSLICHADAVGECIGEPLYCVLRIWA